MKKSKEYNYKKFYAKESNISTSKGLQIGDRVPNFKLISLDGNKVSLFNQANKIIILEFGSITCPIYSANITDMNKLAKKYPDMAFKVLYVREAHPGKKIHKHKNIKEKIELANNIKNHFPENREIVIDNLKGTVHKKLGLLPDMLLVIGKNRKILYRLDWNNLETLFKVLKNIKNGKSVKNIISKSRKIPMKAMLPVLLRAGNDSLFDLIKAIPRMILQKSRKVN